MDLLDLEGWKTTGRIKTDSLDIREAVFLHEPQACISCGVVGELQKHGIRQRDYLDAPAYGLQTVIRVNQRRYRCKACKAIISQPLQGVREDFKMTERAYAYMQRQALQQTFSSVAESLGCNEKTVRNATQELIDRINGTYVPTIPMYLGLDETKMCGDYCAVFTDVGNKRPVDLLPSRDPALIGEWLIKHGASAHIKCVTTDMYQPYRNLVRKLLPGVPVVADKFHVLKMADAAVETIRRRTARSKPVEVGREWKRNSVLLELRRHKLGEKSLQQLNAWLKSEPDLKTAYELKESFYDIYDAPNRETAEALLDAWRESVPKHLAIEARKDYKAVLTATKNWRAEILNYFDIRITNGYTESLNGRIKHKNRAGFGYTFPVLRARFLWPVFHIPKGDLMERLQLPGLVLLDEAHAYGAPPQAELDLFETRKELYMGNKGMCQMCAGDYELAEMTVRRQEEGEPMPGAMVLLCEMCSQRVLPH
uniref:ISL3 family transposase n=1 Tax=Comamonas testosteroni TaxID=285 RepID=UPI0015FDED7F|nr:ISL3 family transposase [Comamonas testosteroni]